MIKRIWPFFREALVALMVVFGICFFIFKYCVVFVSSIYPWSLFLVLIGVAIIIFNSMRNSLAGLVAFIDMVAKKTVTIRGEINNSITTESSYFSYRWGYDRDIISGVHVIVIVKDENKELLQLKSAYELEPGTYDFTVSKHSGIILEARGL